MKKKTRTIQSIMLASIVLSLVRPAESWIQQEVQQATDHDRHPLQHKFNIKDINFGIESRRYTNAIIPSEKITSQLTRLRTKNRKLGKISKKSSKQSKDSSHIDHGYGPHSTSSEESYSSYSSSKSTKTKSSKDYVHAGFMDEEFVEDFEGMFDVMFSGDFSVVASKSYKSAKKSKKSSTTSTKTTKGSKDSKKSRSTSSGKKSMPKLTMPPIDTTSSVDVETPAPAVGSQIPGGPPTSSPVLEPPVDTPTPSPVDIPTEPPVDTPTESPVDVPTTPVPDSPDTPAPGNPDTPAPDSPDTPAPVVPDTPAPVGTPAPETTPAPVSTPAPTPDTTPDSCVEVQVSVTPWTLQYTLEGTEVPTDADYNELEIATADFLESFMEAGFNDSPVNFADMSTSLARFNDVGIPLVDVAYEAEAAFCDDGVVPNQAQLDVILQQAFSGESLIQYEMVLQSLSLMNPFASTISVVFTRGDMPRTESTRSSSGSSSSSRSSAIPGIAVGAVTLLLAFVSAFVFRNRRNSFIRDKEDGEKSRLTGFTESGEDTITANSSLFGRLWKRDDDENDEERALNSTFSHEDSSVYTTNRKQYDYVEKAKRELNTAGSFGSNFSFRTPEEMAHTARSFNIELVPRESQSDDDSKEGSGALASRRSKNAPERRCDSKKPRPWQKRVSLSRYRKKRTAKVRSKESSQASTETSSLQDEESIAHLFGDDYSQSDADLETMSLLSANDKFNKDVASKQAVHETIHEASEDEESCESNCEESDSNSRASSNQTSSCELETISTFGSSYRIRTMSTAASDDESEKFERVMSEDEYSSSHDRYEKEEVERRIKEKKIELAEKRQASDHARQVAEEAIRKVDVYQKEKEARLAAELDGVQAQMKREEDLRLKEEKRLVEARVELELRIESERLERLEAERRKIKERKRTKQTLRQAGDEKRAAEERRLDEKTKLTAAEPARRASKREAEEKLVIKKNEELKRKSKDLERQKRDLQERIRVQQERRKSEEDQREVEAATLENGASTEAHSKAADKQQFDGNRESARSQKRAIEKLLEKEKQLEAKVSHRRNFSELPYDSKDMDDEHQSLQEESSSSAHQSTASSLRSDFPDIDLDVSGEDFSIRSEISLVSRKTVSRESEQKKDDASQSIGVNDLVPVESSRPWNRESNKRDKMVKRVSAATFIPPWSDSSQSAHRARLEGMHHGNRRHGDRDRHGSIGRLDRGQRRSSRRIGQELDSSSSGRSSYGRSMSKKEMSYRKYRTRNPKNNEGNPWWMPNDDDDAKTVQSRGSFARRGLPVTNRARGYSDEDSSTHASSISSDSRSSGYIKSILPR